MTTLHYAAGWGIRHAEVDGFRVILDLRAETYRILDEVGSIMWSVLTGEAEQISSFKRLSDEYKIGFKQLQADLLAFANRCLHEQLLEPIDQPSRPSTATPRRRARNWDVLGKNDSALNAWKCLLATQLKIAREGFRATYEGYAQLCTSIPGNNLQGAISAFLKAENFYVAPRAPDDCLVRSLALYRFLSEAGVPAVHLIGVKRIPFAAHAWVECDGVALLSSGMETFTPLARLSAAS